MTKEEKQLLLQDLCTRLPYGVKVLVDIEKEPEVLYSIDTYKSRVTFSTTYYQRVYIENIKPYLRSMDDMTNEEEFALDETRCYTQLTLESYDWLNAHHFDYRGLIEKGLAIEAPKTMY